VAPVEVGCRAEIFQKNQSLLEKMLFLLSFRLFFPEEKKLDFFKKCVPLFAKTFRFFLKPLEGSAGVLISDNHFESRNRTLPGKGLSRNEGGGDAAEYKMFSVNINGWMNHVPLPRAHPSGGRTDPGCLRRGAAVPTGSRPIRPVWTAR
jgi:hypothetical protein